MKRTGPTNSDAKELIKELKTLSIKEKTPLWKRIATDLERPTRNRRIINLSSLNRFTKEGDLIIVPGKVLGTGDLDHKVTIAAYAFSQSAKDNLEKSKSKAMSIRELIKENPNPKGKNIRILG